MVETDTPEKKEPFEVTTPGDPFKPAWVGADVSYGVWCAALVERIEKIDGRAPRIAHEVRRGKLTDKILVVDDNYTTPSSYTDAVVVQRFIETRSQWEN